MKLSDVDELLSKLTAEMATVGRKYPHSQLARAELFKALILFTDTPTIMWEDYATDDDPDK